MVRIFVYFTFRLAIIVSVCAKWRDVECWFSRHQVSYYDRNIAVRESSNLYPASFLLGPYSAISRKSTELTGYIVRIKSTSLLDESALRWEFCDWIIIICLEKWGLVFERNSRHYFCFLLFPFLLFGLKRMKKIALKKIKK